MTEPSAPWLRAVDLRRHYRRGPQVVKAVDLAAREIRVDWHIED